MEPLRLRDQRRRRGPILCRRQTRGPVGLAIPASTLWSGSRFAWIAFGIIESPLIGSASAKAIRGRIRHHVVELGIES